MTDSERSKTGVPIYHHKSETESKIASYEAKYLEEIENHVGKHIGKIDRVLHEFVSLTVHVDILIVRPTAQIPFLTLITSGMSDLAMTVPDHIDTPEDYELAEVIAFLPDWWPEKHPYFKDFSNSIEKPTGYCPIEWLKFYARMPHEFKTSLAWKHTSANGDPAAPICEGTEMRGFVFLPPVILPEDAWRVRTKNGRFINLLTLIPIHEDEMNLALNTGTDKLIDTLIARDVGVDFSLDRPSALKRKKLFGLL